MFNPPIKKGAGGRRVLPLASISNQAGGMMTKYIQGSGVGASNIAVRRHLAFKATQNYSKKSDTTSSSTVPDPPIITSVTVGYQSATVVFSAPTNDGGSPIISYTVISNPGGITATRSSSPITINGLTNGVTYTFTVIATNSNGDSTSSNISEDSVPNGSPPVNGIVKSAVSFYDNANLGYNTYNNTLKTMCRDSNNNVLAACYARTGTFTINKTDADDGITQTQILTDTFDGSNNFVQGITTYYTYNIEIIKYDTDGIPQWVAKIGGDTNKANTIYDIVTDSSNNVYALVGHGISIVTYYNSDGSVFGTLNNTFAFGNSLAGRYCLIKYNANGQIQWVNTITVGDNNNQFVFAYAGNLAVDSNDNVYMTAQSYRAGGGVGPTSIKFYEYSSVDGSNVIQFTLTTTDSYPFNMPYVDGQWQRGFLIKINNNSNYDWIARMVIPMAYGEQNSGPINKNIVVDSDDNIYVCVGTITAASSPICNIYSGVSASTNPLSALASPYYRLDLRGNSITPSTPQYYKFSAIVKFNNNGVFQRASCAHQLHNGSSILDMNPYIGIDKATNSLYISMNAQGFTGTNTMSGAQLDKLYINDFSSNTSNGSNYDIKLSSAYTLTLAQPQQVVAIVKFNSSLIAQTMSYINTPSGNYISPVVVDSTGKVYITTTISNNTTTKSIYTFDSLSGSSTIFNNSGNINATTTNSDGLIVSFSGDLKDLIWAAPITSSDGLNNTGFTTIVDSSDNIYVGGTATLNKDASNNFVNLYNYNTVSSGNISNSLFGSMDVTNATDKVGFIIKYT
jgi:hypothetical protein